MPETCELRDAANTRRLETPGQRWAREYLERTENERWLETLSVEYPSRKVFRFWQPGGGFDRNIFREKTVPAVIDYIHANPVRRGLVAQPTDWEWSSAHFWKRWPEVPLQMDHPDDPR